MKVFDELEILPGKYVVAVSGGVDSMVLLDILHHKPGLELIVAHFDHGIRSDSGLDQLLIKERADSYGLELEVGSDSLGPEASEATARSARYAFLSSIRAKRSAKSIITAHHQDDAIETALLNLQRGTNRRGLSAIADNPQIFRPLLNISKKDILEYAYKNDITWREDSTNSEQKFARNRLRTKLEQSLTPDQRQSAIDILQKSAQINKQINLRVSEISNDLEADGKLSRQKIIMLPSEIGRELIAHQLRAQGVMDYDKKTIDRLYLVVKTARPGTKHPVRGQLQLSVGVQSVQFMNSSI